VTQSTALRECLPAGDVPRALTVARTGTGQSHPKLHELVHGDLFDYRDMEVQLTGLMRASSVSASPPRAWTRRSARG
jgi:hypothetical protein